MLENHGAAYLALHQGERVPVNREEERFLAVCRGELDPASEHEKVWALFLRKTEKRPSISAFGESSPNHSKLDRDLLEEFDNDAL